MKNQIIEADKVLKSDLTDKTPVNIQMMLGGKKTDVKLSNYYADYQNTATDLILFESEKYAFTITRDHAYLTLEQQIREIINE